MSRCCRDLIISNFDKIKVLSRGERERESLRSRESGLSCESGSAKCDFHNTLANWGRVKERRDRKRERECTNGLLEMGTEEECFPIVEGEHPSRGGKRATALIFKKARSRGFEGVNCQTSGGTGPIDCALLLSTSAIVIPVHARLPAATTICQYISLAALDVY